MFLSVLVLAASLISTNEYWVETGDNLHYRRISNPATNVVSLAKTMSIGYAIRRPLLLNGTVVAITPPGFVLRDGTGGTILKCRKDITPQAGEQILAWGVLHHFSSGNQVAEARSIKRLGYRPPSPPIAATPEEITHHKGDYSLVVFDGVVTEATKDEIDDDWNWILVRRDGITAAVCCNDPTISTEALNRLIDAKVSVTGVALPVGSEARKHMGVRVAIPTLDAISVLDSPPDPFSEENKAAVHEHVHKTAPVYEHRQRISGTVIASWRNRHLFVQTDDNLRLRIHLNQETSAPPANTRIIAAGFVRHNSFFTWLDNAVIRTEPGAPLVSSETPANISTMTEASPDGSCHFNPLLNGRLVRLNGRIASTFASGPDHSSLGLVCGAEIIQIELGGLAPPPLNAEIGVTGICAMSVENSTDEAGFGHITGFTVIARDTSDIVILKNPPWWTPTRFFTVIALLLLLIAAIILRNHLKAKRIQIESALRLDERNRLAVELHDSLAQNLTGISLQLDAAEMAEAEDRDTALMHLGNAREALRSCREGLRYCLSDLRSRSFEDSDMTEAVTETVRPHIGKTHLAVRFNVPRSRLSDSSAHAVLCIVRELAVNAVRHGHATDVRVAGEDVDGVIRFSVADNGCGFDPATCPGSAQGHFGLMGIRERIQSFNGKLVINSTPNKGTKITITLNLKT